ncbi:hypothetical protein A3742_13685 [Oleiphilus sp. HI0071]|uniref:bifunctional folylpolyglutamate synthase/dihydrofolate synthase n=2 Tax=Oleiphilus TaxID=141450 RepID=UPI0007C3843C|nr:MULTISPECIES: folylpolyglutamate synthase/dihydrofolate synthase family protein [unclassified Oleiphilus]KZY59146.1 hypothetical protein A3737_07630 [Oleiphilus sp. HI0065]KZY80120.1 hypothetical protein A3742_13685 [Oleiphilus sp. HI0071]KZY96616.1 hypothetical protein A3744_13415 [Oleiphilus sp. HI0073]KZZ40832.1 hypothetical protein A3758_08975 [Oleiphilus sp. HI0118]KZZ50874.1 hypothetical protein A3760_13605 [Oleiphilus sp. HI0122]KZZ74141.1 hypothetical protein A3767_03790 [Oleiphilu
MTLSEWLNDLEQRHPTEIDLGLERVRLVFDRLQLTDSMPYCIVVGGTNGKGSTLKAIENGLSSVGLRIGTYTSPHLYRFNERICLQGKEVGDQTLVDAFDVVERARGDISLTYFEFTTLAAFVVFSNAFRAGELDAIICEVGLGGRLDAVNVLDGDLSLVTSIGLDHQDWLGNTIEEIAREKAGIFRPSKLGLVGETFPNSILNELIAVGYSLSIYGEDFGITHKGDCRFEFFTGSKLVLLDPCQQSSLPKNNLCLAMQACIIALEAKEGGELTPKTLDRCAKAISKTQVPGRLQQVSEEPVIIFDVAHNEAAAQFLADYLSNKHLGRKVRAVFSCLKDKDIRAIVRIMSPFISEWFIAPLKGSRAMSVEAIENELSFVGAQVRSFDDLSDAFAAASDVGCSQDAMVLAFGSFYVLESLGERILVE